MNDNTQLTLAEFTRPGFYPPAHLPPIKRPPLAKFDGEVEAVRTITTAQFVQQIIIIRQPAPPEPLPKKLSRYEAETYAIGGAAMVITVLIMVLVFVCPLLTLNGLFAKLLTL
jgi:hypothetical protein